MNSFFVKASKKYLFAVAVIVLLAAGCAKQSNNQPQQTQPTGNQNQPVVFDGRLQIDSPKEGDTVGQTFTVTGKAQDWFEGNISVAVLDTKDNQLYTSSFTVPDNYGQQAVFSQPITLVRQAATDSGRIEFIDYSAKDGSVVYKKTITIHFINYTTSNNNLLSYAAPQDAFSFHYTDDFGFNTDIKQIRSVSYIPVCNDNMVACVFYTGQAYKGTNFEGAGVSININKSLNTAAKCYNFAVSTNAAQTKVPDVGINGLIFRSATGGDAGAGHFHKVQVYRNFRNNSCYEIAQNVSYSSISNFEPGSIKEFNQDEAWKKLQTIINSFTFGPAVAETPVSVAPGPNQVTLTGTIVCLPHRNAQPGQPQTLECAIGLKESATGKYYGLKNNYKPIYDTNSKVQVIGTLVDDSKSNYDTVGAIEVSSIVKL